MNRQLIYLLGLGMVLAMSACTGDSAADIDPDAPHFILLEPAETGIDFNNAIQETPKLNHYVWQSLYNGGGVATGDLNGDGLPEVLLTGNVVADKLYQNNGDLQFSDMTADAGLADNQGWSFGANIVDVNGDGHLDIYICRSGPYKEAGRRNNKLYINDGKGVFTEQAAAYGIDHDGYSMQSAFFDFDKDGDLDLYLVNQPPDGRFTTGLNPDDLKRNPLYSDRFFRNDNGKFTDITQRAGIRNYSYGLSVSVADFNEDGWLDVYVANDYEAPDHLYINNGQGSFVNKIHEQVKHISFYAMGSDAADYNNDGLTDVVAVDMAAADHYRSKTNMGSMNINQFWRQVNEGGHYQFMFNTLQLNNGNGSFSDVGQLAGISKTDWSWAALFADLDNDGWKDLMVTNGIQKDIRNNDLILQIRKEIEKGNQQLDPMRLVAALPSVPLSNYVYHNQGDLSFKNVAQDWGMGQAGFSNGLSVADLDRDGDLDVIVNNVGSPASIYANNKGRLNNYLRIQLTGPEGNPFGIGTKVTLTDGTSQQVQHLSTARGYLSSVEPILHFGVGQATTIPTVIVDWPNGKQSTLTDVATNQTLSVSVKDAGAPAARENSVAQLFKTGTAPDFTHQENDFNDFGREILLPNRQSVNGPYLAVGDVNGDGLDDCFVGGAADQPGRLFLRTDSGWQAATGQPWQAQAACEDMGATLFDADGDNDLDLYVVSGGSEFPTGSPLYQDRLYLNDGSGNFGYASAALPNIAISGQRVAVADIDGDNDMDLFIGGHLIPGAYPAAPSSILLRNDGGRFTDVTQEIAPALTEAGMLNDATFADMDGDGDMDLLAAGEWTPVQLFINDGGRFTDATERAVLNKHKGWWYSLTTGDFDGDGDIDIVAGNLGANTKFKASEQKPFRVYGSDFDGNGTNDIVLAAYTGNKLLPVRGRECSSEQLPYIADKFPTYDGFARAGLEEILTDEGMQKAAKGEVTTFRSTLFINNGGGQFVARELPLAAQMAPIRSLAALDLNDDGHLDLIGVGNLYGAEVETIRYDAGTGVCLLNDGTGTFRAVPARESGLFAANDSRDLAIVQKPRPAVIVSNNNDAVQLFEMLP